MKTTVVISNYNYAKFVRSAIDSCLQQSVPCDIIVVDDASTDGSWEVISSYVSLGVRAVKLKQNSGGNARGKNVGICLAKSPYVTCLDADDMLLPSSIAARRKHLPDFDFVNGRAFRQKSTKKYSSILRQITPKLDMCQFPERSKKLLKEGPRWAFAIEASTVLAKKELYEKFGLYDEEMRWTIDREMWHRWLSHGVTNKVLEEYVSIYRHHPNQVTHDRSRKDPKKCSAMLSERIKSRKEITAENTLLMCHYDPESFIDQLLEP